MGGGRGVLKLISDFPDLTVIEGFADFLIFFGGGVVTNFENYIIVNVNLFIFMPCLVKLLEESTLTDIHKFILAIFTSGKVVSQFIL